MSFCILIYLDEFVCSFSLDKWCQTTIPVMYFSPILQLFAVTNILLPIAQAITMLDMLITSSNVQYKMCLAWNHSLEKQSTGFVVVLFFFLAV